MEMWAEQWIGIPDSFLRVSLNFRGETLEVSGLPAGKAASGHILPPAGRFQFCRLPSGQWAWHGAFLFSLSQKEGVGVLFIRPPGRPSSSTRKSCFSARDIPLRNLGIAPLCGKEHKEFLTAWHEADYF